MPGGRSKSKKKKSKSKGNKENAAGGGDGNVAGHSGGDRVNEQAGFGNQHGSRGHSTSGGCGDGGNWRDLTVRVSAEPQGQSATSPKVTNPVEAEEVRQPSAEAIEETSKVVETTSVEVYPSIAEAEAPEPKEEALAESTPEAPFLPPPAAPEPRKFPVKGVKVNSTSNVVNCLLEADLLLSRSSITVGQDLYTSKIQKYEGHPLWDSYKFVNREPTGFSSLSFGMNDEAIKKIGTTDFVGDAECFKKIFMMAKSPDAVSLVMHRVGNSILVDNYELTDLLYASYPVHVTEWDDFAKFVLRVIDKEKSKIPRNGRTLNELHRKAVMHYLLYKCFQGDLAFKPAAEPLPLHNVTQPPKIDLKGASTKFMHTRLWEIGGYEFLVGSQVPLFQMSPEDEDSGDTGLKSDVETTIGLNNDYHEEALSLDNGMNLWLDNLILDAKQTFLCHQVDSYVTATQVIKTEDIPVLASFDPVKTIEQAKDVLDLLKSFVVEAGTTYWLYKGPGAEHFMIYDLSRELADNQVGVDSISTVKSTKYNPYMEGIGSLLYRMCSLHGTKYHPLALNGMLTHILQIFPLETHPMLALSTTLIHLESRIPSELDSDLRPKLGVMHKMKSPNINFPYDWHGPELEKLISTMEPTVRDPHLDHHLTFYKNLGTIYEPETLSNFFQSSSDFTLPKHDKYIGVDRLGQMIAPLHNKEIKPPSMVAGLLRRARLSDDLEQVFEERSPSSRLSKAEQDCIKSIQILSKQGPTFPNVIRLTFSLTSFAVVIPKETSTPMTETETELGVNPNLCGLKFFEFSGTSRKSHAESQSVTTPRSGGSKKRKMDKQAPPPVVPSSQDKSVFPKLVDYKLSAWLKFCEEQDLIRVFSSCLRLVLQLNEKFNEKNFKPTKKSKKLEVPFEFMPLKRRLYDKVALFALHLAYEAANSDSRFPSKVMMTRYCARLAIFLGKEFGEPRQEVQISAWVVSGLPLKHLITSMDDICDVKRFTMKFEDGLRDHCAEFMEFVKLALDKRKPEQTFEFKSYDLFPYPRAPFHNSVVEAFLRHDLGAFSATIRQRISETISMELGNIGAGFLSTFRQREFRVDGKSKERLESHTLELVSNATVYLDEAFKRSASTAQLAQLYMSMAQVHEFRTHLIFTEHPEPSPLVKEAGKSMPSTFVREACQSIYVESMQCWNDALDLLELEPLQDTGDTTTGDTLSLYKKARWEAFNLLLEMCNNLWLLKETNPAGLEETLNHYAAALKLVENEDLGEFATKETVQTRKAEIYEAMAVTRKKLAASEREKNFEAMYSDIAKDYYSASMIYAQLEHHASALSSYLSYMDSMVAHLKGPEEKVREELKLLCEARSILENYRVKPASSWQRWETPTPIGLPSWKRNTDLDETIGTKRPKGWGIIKIFSNPRIDYTGTTTLANYLVRLETALKCGDTVLDESVDIQNLISIVKKVSVAHRGTQGAERSMSLHTHPGAAIVVEQVLDKIIDKIKGC